MTKYEEEVKELLQLRKEQYEQGLKERAEAEKRRNAYHGVPDDYYSNDEGKYP
jgi:hypothetical protein